MGMLEVMRMEKANGVNTPSFFRVDLIARPIGSFSRKSSSEQSMLISGAETIIVPDGEATSGVIMALDRTWLTGMAMAWL